MDLLNLDQEIARLARAMVSRDSRIVGALISYLQSQLSLAEVAGLLVICLERLLWLDHEAFLWSVKLIPHEVLPEIRHLFVINRCQQLIGQGLIPGQDFSVDASGRLLMGS